ncbi:bifunctional glutamate N-acetyltransferase/amino-acid acetyltransferase ArgJ [Alkaliphilus peptidifermentans]|uniref:Arginine biosynthesis bifunctional protein ArgJ n=1 Tax=Alkaliphilus peptidifermentans DSM 18978 TaxID=1120976 RepID=A0A1G5HNW5_9FIRM|nr:bifunctional glutamate N-acetyltransferase/amino-acid acetyltransferase ArgJ [Alkaliphilus peptidifermentans]SCY65404.1 glutamate N-acetyltransferase [Alkaliphilus peptidifermentans DSM 18978]
MKIFEIYDGDVTSPKGFLASGIHAGLKKSRKDIAIITSEVMGVGAAVFTTNKACAAPIIVSKTNIESGKLQGIVVNSGNANACTGIKGLEDSHKMLKMASESLNIPKENLLVASTGVIGVPLPIDIVLKGIKTASQKLSYEGGRAATEAIMTTDIAIKNIAVSVNINEKKVVIGGIAKGSGMIHPNMATMLAFITTDINIDGEFLNDALKIINQQTYNMITVDGDTSTNDMVAVIANGLAENAVMNWQHPEVNKFLEAFYYVNEYLAKSIVRDGEGATKFIEVEAINCNSIEDARQTIKSILTSNLVKTAFFGEDGNWGRILCSIGYAGVDLTMDKIAITLKSDGGTIKIVEAGQGTNYSEEDMSVLLKHQDIKVIVDFNQGKESAKGWGCDLSYEYVKINGAYRT